MPSRQDLELSKNRTLPAQNTNNNSASIDLGTATQFEVGSNTEVEVYVPATACATGQTITVTIQDSADDSSFAQVAQLETLVLTGSSNATAATTRKWRLPSTVRRYIRMNVACSATTGDLTANTATFKLLT